MTSKEGYFEYHLVGNFSQKNLRVLYKQINTIENERERERESLIRNNSEN